MFKSYLKTSVRFLLKNRTFSFINIIGLTVGTVSCLYIFLFIKYHYGFDQHHERANAIYRVNTLILSRGDKFNSATISPPIAPVLKQDLPEVEQYTRVAPTLGSNKSALTYQDRSFYEKDVVYVDSTFFKMFSYAFVNGRSRVALKEPYSVVLMKPVATKLFGNADPVNKLISINNGYGKHDFKVTAVVDESAGMSHLKASMFITMNSGGIGDFVLKNNGWAGNNFVSAYIRLREGADAKALEKKLPALLNKYGGQELRELGFNKQLSLQPITSIHTSTGLKNEPTQPIASSFLLILSLIAVLIQVIACINFMNLSTARASSRAREVGVRKVIGAEQGDLVKQFLSESLILTLLSVLIALPLLALILPYLNNITGIQLDLSVFVQFKFWLVLAGIILLTGVLAGSYPAFYLSAFKAIKVIKGDFVSRSSAAGIRRSLVVFQFVLSIVLITGIIVIYSQLNYIKNKDLGFSKDQKLVFSVYTPEAIAKLNSLASDVKQLPEVKAVSRTDNFPGQSVFRDHGVYLAGGNMANSVDAQNMLTDEHFTEAIGVKLLSGRKFGVNDSGKVLINETMARRLGLTIDKAPGTYLYTQYAPDPITHVEVAGVIKDLNYSSLHTEIKPFMLVYRPQGEELNNLVVSIQSNDPKQLLSRIEAIWKRDIPDVPFEYSFLDAAVQKQYEADITLSQIINAFTIVAILISCLGLFGLAAFSAEQRRKEIGIRKVLGSSASGIVALLSRDFLKLVLVAIVISLPIAWYFMHAWIRSFAYRISISWWMFALSGALAVLIAMFTIGLQALKAANMNPVRTLRSE